MLAICWEDGCPNHIHMLTHFEDTFTAHAMPSLHARHSMPHAPEVSSTIRNLGSKLPHSLTTGFGQFSASVSSNMGVSGKRSSYWTSCKHLQQIIHSISCHCYQEPLMFCCVRSVEIFSSRYLGYYGAQRSLAFVAEY